MDLNIIVSLIGLGISVYALCQSSKANGIASSALEFSKIKFSYSQDKDKQKNVDEIVKYVVDNWSKDGGARVALLSQWNIYKDRDFTVSDFNGIWEMAYLLVKKRKPKESFEAILNNSNKDSG